MTGTGISVDGDSIAKQIALGAALAQRAALMDKKDRGSMAILAMKLRAQFEDDPLSRERLAEAGRAIVAERFRERALPFDSAFERAIRAAHRSHPAFAGKSVLDELIPDPVKSPLEVATPEPVRRPMSPPLPVPRQAATREDVQQIVDDAMKKLTSVPPPAPHDSSWYGGDGKKRKIGFDITKD